MTKRKLKFGLGNAKLAKFIAIFNLPAGHTCAGAKDCLSRADRITGKITDGKDILFRCFAASNECLFKNVRKSRWNNFTMLRGKSVEEMSKLIEDSLPRKATHIRIHGSGDFFSLDYFDAWRKVALRNPHLVFYAYTKALPFWITRMDGIPLNLHLVASLGGRYDSMINTFGLRSARVVNSENEAKSLNLPIDHDDSHVYNYSGDFALLLHGTQPAGSKAAKDWENIKNHGQGGYKSDYFAHYKVKEKACSS